MISVVVCTFNGKSRISACLTAIINQENYKDYELIVVDNASEDATSFFVQEHLTASGWRGSWKVVEEKKPGLLAARIAGLKAAKYEWVLFCDDDNLIFPDFLSNAALHLKQSSNLGVLGAHGIPQFETEKPEWFEKYASSFAVGAQLNGSPDYKKLKHVYGACSIYRKSSFLAFIERGFLPALSGRKSSTLASGDDVEWCWLMQLMGYDITYSEQLKFYHQIPVSRLSWGYYLRLKEGISSSAGLLSTYKIYYEKNVKSKLRFQILYILQLLTAALLYIKHRVSLGKQPEKPSEQLTLVILQSRMKSYFTQWKQSRKHFNQIIKYFES